eukprot:6017174-Amphidinium_carterae.5
MLCTDSDSALFWLKLANTAGSIHDFIRVCPQDLKSSQNGCRQEVQHSLLNSLRHLKCQNWVWHHADRSNLHVLHVPAPAGLLAAARRQEVECITRAAARLPHPQIKKSPLCQVSVA